MYRERKEAVAQARRKDYAQEVSRVADRVPLARKDYGNSRIYFGKEKRRAGKTG